MGSLYAEVKKTVDTILKSYGLSDYQQGTVISISPLRIKISDRITLEKSQLILTRAVVYRTIDCSHVHDVSANVGSAGVHSHSVTGTTASAGAEAPHSHSVTGDTDSAGDHTHAVSVSSDAVGLPKPIVIVEGLDVGDQVVLLSVNRGQKYIVLSKEMT